MKTGHQKCSYETMCKNRKLANILYHGSHKLNCNSKWVPKNTISNNLQSTAGSHHLQVKKDKNNTKIQVRLFTVFTVHWSLAQITENWNVNKDE